MSWRGNLTNDERRRRSARRSPQAPRAKEAIQLFVRLRSTSACSGLGEKRGGEGKGIGQSKARFGAGITLPSRFPAKSLTWGSPAHLTGPGIFHRSAATVTFWRLSPPPLTPQGHRRNTVWLDAILQCPW